MHLTAEILERLLEGKLSKVEREQAARHLLSRCPECMALAQEIAARHGMVYTSGRFQKANRRKHLDARLDRMSDRSDRPFQNLRERLAAERLIAAGQWSMLLKFSQARRLALIAADPTLQTYGLYERALDAAREITPANPTLGLTYAEISITIAQSLEATLYGQPQKTDMIAAALAVRGNAKRVAEDFDGARVDLEMAAEELKRGTNDAIEHATILSLQGSWNTDLGYFEEAEKCLRKAVNIHKSTGEDHLIGRTMVQLGIAIGHLNPKKGIEILDDASAYVSVTSDPLTELCMRHNLAWFLNDAGRVQEAIGVLEDSRGLYRQFRHRAYQLRLRWLEGRINRNLGNIREAEATFDSISTDLLAKNLTQEYLLCSIDLAESVYAQGDTTRTIQLCQSLFRALESWHLHSDALGALMMFTEALKEGANQTGTFLLLAQYFRRNWFFHHEPDDTVH